MKRIRLILCLMLMIGIETISAETYTGYCGENLIWSFNTEDSTLLIEGYGEMPDWEDRSYIPWDRFKSKIAYLSLPNGLVNIANKAFQNCFNLFSVSLPESVLTIGDDAFNACTSLVSATIPDGVSYIGRQAFVHCTSLSSVTIGKSVTTIGEYAFATCDNLNSVIIPESVTALGEGAFSSCKNLVSIDVLPNNRNYQSNDGVLYSADNSTLIQFPAGRTGEYIIPDGVIYIAPNAFRGSRELNSVIIPNTVANIGEAAFLLCSGMESLTNYATEPQSIDNSVFEYVDQSKCILYVPKESLISYEKVDIWKDFAQIIGVEAPQGIENPIKTSHKVILFENGQIFILRGNKTYSATGQEVK